MSWFAGPAVPTGMNLVRRNHSGTSWRALALLAALAGASCGKSSVAVLGPPDGSSNTGAPGGGAAGTSGGASPACPTACTGGQACVNGACACPAYQSFCGGACIPTSSDPHNCGGCGVACAGVLACSSGTCAATCLPGLDSCSGSCVDRTSDNQNCGACGTVCPKDQGCVKGSCQPAVPVGSGPASCAGVGPAIVVAPSQGGCLGNLAQTTFRWGLCSCQDVRVSDKLLVDAYDSTRGPYLPGGLGGGVGVNGGYETSAAAEIWGALWCAANEGVDTKAPNTVKQELRVGGPFHTSDTFSVGEDAYVAGNVSTSSSISIGKTLRVPAAATVGSGVTYAALSREAVTVAPPCDCQPQQLVPIAGIVAAHRPPNNDDASLGLDAAAFAAAAGGPRRLDLPCGNYFLTGIAQSEALTIAAHGRTALYIDGDVHSSNALTFAVEPGAELDLFIAGTIDVSDTLIIGSPNYPAASRTYVGSPSGLHFSAGSRVGGNVYAAYGLVTWSAGSDIYGSVYAGDFSASSTTTIHYDRAVLVTGAACPAPAPTPDAGAPGCGSCKDCGNQACINGACAACRTSADCCPPLVCGAGGRCVPNLIP